MALFLRNVKFHNGDHVTSQTESDKVVHTLHLAHTLYGLPSVAMLANNPQNTFHHLLAPE